jgi:hypothetical protein
VIATASAAAVAVFVPAVASASASAPAAAGPATHVHARAVQLARVGSVNFAAVAKKVAASRSASPAAGPSASVTAKPRVAPLRRAPMANAGQHPLASARRAAPAVRFATALAGNVTGAKGFNGINSTTSLALNGFDVTPPDMGLGTGTSSRGTAVLQAVNLAVEAFTPSGHVLAGPVSLNAFFGLSPAWFTSDPRVYWDPQTRHWFLTMITVGPPFGGAGTSSMQFIAVSRTTNALGNYTIFSFDTSTSAIDNSICPCLGDFNMVGADNSGFYITTNEFPITGPGFNGTNLYAMSKKGLIAAARGGPAVPVFQYPIPTLSDPFGAFHLAPSSVTQGSFAPNNEYFVESDAISVGNSALEVWALTGTKSLNASTPTAPPLSEASVATQGYSVPPNAVQKSGPIPFGNTVGAKVASPLQTDFNAVQQVTYASGEVYAQLNTGVNAGGGATNAGVAWFALHPRPGTGSVSVTNNGNGYVRVNGHLLYPSIGVNARGNGYIAFAMSSGSRFPTAAYIRFAGRRGAVGPVRIQKAGTRPLDDLSCYPGSGSGPACRYGDYSMTQVFNGRVYLATEYVHALTNVAGGAQANWATRIWSVPVP